MILEEITEPVAPPKRRGRPPGSKNKPKAPAAKGRSWKGENMLDPDEQIEKAAKIVHDAHGPTMVPAKRRGRPPKDDPTPHEKQMGPQASWKKSWTAELHGDKYVFFADGKKVGQLATKENDIGAKALLLLETCHPFTHGNSLQRQCNQAP
jgi:hypothetical protein